GTLNLSVILSAAKNLAKPYYRCHPEGGTHCHPEGGTHCHPEGGTHCHPEGGTHCHPEGEARRICMKDLHNRGLQVCIDYLIQTR
ncbi:MAG TPA: hypothetical protein GXX46_00520, partial [Peptococcaceae bacterium]|nr:hypothetical protein [Peptococcaceae bacterium]